MRDFKLQSSFFNCSWSDNYIKKMCIIDFNSKPIMISHTTTITTTAHQYLPSHSPRQNKLKKYLIPSSSPQVYGAIIYRSDNLSVLHPQACLVGNYLLLQVGMS